MSRRWFSRLSFLLAVVVGWFPVSGQGTGKPGDSAERAPAIEDLPKLVGRGFADPRGAERVSFDMPVRSVWGQCEREKRQGWRKVGGTEIVFDDGVPAPPEWISGVEPVDFLTQASARYAHVTPPGSDDPFARMTRAAVGDGPVDLANAVWLEAAGRHREAAVALECAHQGREQSKVTVLSTWRHQRAWFYFAGMVHAYMQRADAEAETYGSLLFRHFPNEAKKTHPQAASILAEIRRRKAGPAPTLPENLEALPVAERIDACVAALQEIDVKQDGQPGGVDLAEAAGVKALIAIGDAAMPRLLEVFEKDRRLTRSVHFWRDFNTSRTVLGVHEAALTAVMSILRVQFFEEASTGDNFTARGDVGRTRLAKQLRAYWKRYGRLPFDERMMAILTNPAASSDARLEAARNLASPHAEQTFGTTFGTGRFEDPGGSNPAIVKFNNPTAAEALPQAVDIEFAAIAAKEVKWGKSGRKQVSAEEAAKSGFVFKERFFAPEERRQVVANYAPCFEALGDKRVAPVLAARASATADISSRADWALAADRLGDSSAVIALRDALVANSLEPPASEAMFAVFHCLVSATAENAIAGLRAINQPDHRWRQVTARLILSDHDDWAKECRSHPWALEFLASLLDDTGPSGWRHLLRFDETDGKWELFERDPDGNGHLPDGTPFLDESHYDREWELRLCDRAVITLLTLLGDHTKGSFQPLAKSRDATVAEMRSYMKAHRSRLRNLRDHLDGGTGWSIEESALFLPVIPKLDRPATQLDVAEGRALFALDSPGPVPDLQVPSGAKWLARKPSGVSSDPDYMMGQAVVVLQVERDAAGDLWFGIANGNGFFVVPGREVGTLTKLPDEAISPPRQGEQ